LFGSNGKQEKEEEESEDWDEFEKSLDLKIAAGNFDIIGSFDSDSDGFLKMPKDIIGEILDEKEDQEIDRQAEPIIISSQRDRKYERFYQNKVSYLEEDSSDGKEEKEEQEEEQEQKVDVVDWGLKMINEFGGSVPEKRPQPLIMIKPSKSPSPEEIKEFTTETGKNIAKKNGKSLASTKCVSTIALHCPEKFGEILENCEPKIRDGVLKHATRQPNDCILTLLTSGKSKQLTDFADLVFKCKANSKRDLVYLGRGAASSLIDTAKSGDTGTLTRSNTPQTRLLGLIGQDFGNSTASKLRGQITDLLSKLPKGADLKSKDEGVRQEAAAFLKNALLALLKSIKQLPISPEICSIAAEFYSKTKEKFDEEIALQQAGACVFLRAINPALTEAFGKIPKEEEKNPDARARSTMIIYMTQCVQSAVNGVPFAGEKGDKAYMLPMEQYFDEIFLEVRSFVKRAVVEGQNCCRLFDAGIDLQEKNVKKLLMRAANAGLTSCLFVYPSPDDMWGTLPISGLGKLTQMIMQAREDIPYGAATTRQEMLVAIFSNPEKKAKFLKQVAVKRQRIIELLLKKL
jgi:hypothetical protein